MTRETAKKHLETITAFANGKEVQCLAFGKYWQDLDEPCFVADAEYRVKSKRVFAFYNERTKDIEHLSDEERNFLAPCGWEKVELIKFNE